MNRLTELSADAASKKVLMSTPGSWPVNDKISGGGVFVLMVSDSIRKFCGADSSTQGGWTLFGWTQAGYPG